MAKAAGAAGTSSSSTPPSKKPAGAKRRPLKQIEGQQSMRAFFAPKPGPDPPTM